ncbi:hypothetical protein B0H15DRAFT_914524 [Mycena belliarum]|uniref:Uncharacterized protein n=1 Tax=Mycena belliarum TaxID=1033014 RepID=A0AAD6TUN2_9AGAR|nr:hypothetical protein B0H15DRAFT_914524 [Mycena belliae]
MDVTPADLPLPAFLDPLLAYLSDSLPAPIYSFLLTLLSHSLALCTALYSLFLSLLSTHPLQWDAQTVLPPLIALLTSYLALVSLYRTTSWMFRTSLWFVKWGTIVGGLVAASSWLLFQQDGNAMAGHGIVASVGSLILNLLNGDGRNAAGRTRAQPGRQAKKKPSTRQPKTKPKPWDSFDRHREWQFQENGEAQAANDGGVQDVLGNIMDVAGKAMKESGWWDVAKGVLSGESEESRGREPEASTNRKRKANTKTR